MRELQHLQGHNGRAVRILDTLAAQWEHIAIAIGLETADINIISRDHAHDASQACLHLFIHWLDEENYPLGQGSLLPPTWQSLHQSLIHAGFNSIADEIKQILENK